MNKLMTIGLGAAAVIAVLFIGSRFIGSPTATVGGPASEPPASVAPSQAPPSPVPSQAASPVWVGLPAGPFLITGADGAREGGPAQITVDIASPDWGAYTEVDGLSKDDDGKDAPETVGAMLLGWSWPAGTGFNVYGDPCHWSTTIPDTPATTADEIAAGFAAQASRDATAPVDVTVGGFTGKAITLHVPMSYHQQPDVPRDEEFAECDQNIFAMYGLEGNEAVDTRNAQGPGQIDELWILDVNGAIVILDAAYSPATPADVVDELRTMAESATFE